MTTAERNPKDSLKSTWRKADKSTWNTYHHIFDHIDLYHDHIDKPVPVHAKSEKIPVVSDFDTNRWVLVHAIWPIAVHYLYNYLTGKTLNAWAAGAFYLLAFFYNGMKEFKLMRELGHQYGFFDGDAHERDGIPDVRVKEVFWSVLLTGIWRPVMTIALAYNRNQTPGFSSWILVEAGLYGIVLDFYFYWYHRVMHDVDFLWKFHRTHHLTKHPNPLLSLYADQEQEVFDIFVIPLLTWLTMRAMGLPMGFFDWWLCQEYVVFAEMWGHSGLRMFLVPPNPASRLLRLVDGELTTEDHDLHHRKGWKKSFNYGKQTKLWDNIFGTTGERIEATAENIDYSSVVRLPIFF